MGVSLSTVFKACSSIFHSSLNHQKPTLYNSGNFQTSSKRYFGSLGNTLEPLLSKILLCSAEMLFLLTNSIS